MRIKEFKVGQVVFVMDQSSVHQDGLCIVETSVAKVGRKYVTISGNWGAQFEETTDNSWYQGGVCESGLHKPDLPGMWGSASCKGQVFLLDNKVFVPHEVYGPKDMAKVNILDDCSIDLSKVFPDN